MSEPGAVLECPQHKMAWEDFDWHPPDDPEKTVRLKRCPVRGCKERPPKSQGGAQRGGGGWRGKSPEELAQQKELAILERASIERQTALKAAVDWAKAQLAILPIPIGTETIGAIAQDFAAFLTGTTAPDAPTATPEPAKVPTPATDAAKGIVDAEPDISLEEFTKAAKGLSLEPLGMTLGQWRSKGRTLRDALAKIKGG